MDIFLIIISVFAPVPFFHLWLHALLSFWRRKPVLFYVLCLFFWIFSFWFFSKLSAVSSLFYSPSAFLYAIGFVLIISGLLLMAYSILTLGFKRFFVWAVLVPSSVKQKRIISGLFKIIPHPAYIGEILIISGAFLASGKTYILFVFIFIMALFPIAIYFEEKELSERIKYA